MVIFDQKLWSEPSIDIFIWSVSKHYSREHSFIHFNVWLSSPFIKKKSRNGLKCHFLVRIWPFLTRNCDLSSPRILLLKQYWKTMQMNIVLVLSWQKWSKMLTRNCYPGHPIKIPQGIKKIISIQICFLHFDVY